MSACFDEGMGRSVVGYGNAINITTDTIKIMLLSAYTHVKTHQFVSDITGATGVELNTTNYAPGFSGSGRKTLSGASITKDTTNNQIVLTFTNPVYTALGPAAGGPVITNVIFYKNGTSDADSCVLANLTGSLQTNGGNVTIVLDATNGAWRLTI